MEDNEFEEATIISHTDHGTSVLPQSTAERLMKEIKLEVTQKISQNENVKLGSLQHSTTPTLLDSIYQNVLEPASLLPKKQFIFSVIPHPWREERYSVCLRSSCYHFNDRLESQFDSLFLGYPELRAASVVFWKNWLVLIEFFRPVMFFDSDTRRKVYESVNYFDNVKLPFLVCTESNIYMKNSEHKIARIDSRLCEDVLQDLGSHISSFCVSCGHDGAADRVVTLNKTGLVTEKSQHVQLSSGSG